MADVMVYTEPGPELSSAAPGRVVSTADRALPGEKAAWVAIVGAGVVQYGKPLPCSRLAVAATTRVAGRTIVVYGSVLPWRAIRAQAPELVLPGEHAGDAFARLLAAQVADIQCLQAGAPDALVVWAGDFNQSLEGPNVGGSARGRALLREALASLRFAAWNAASEHARPGLCAIDLVCGPRELQARCVERIAPGAESDHAGGVVELA